MHSNTVAVIIVAVIRTPVSKLFPIRSQDLCPIISCAGLRSALWINQNKSSSSIVSQLYEDWHDPCNSPFSSLNISPTSLLVGHASYEWFLHSPSHSPLVTVLLWDGTWSCLLPVTHIIVLDYDLSYPNSLIGGLSFFPLHSSSCFQIGHLLPGPSLWASPWTFLITPSSPLRS